MKRLFLLSVLFLFLAGCGKDKITYLTPVHVSVGEFLITVEDDLSQSKDTALSQYEAAKAVTLAIFNADGSLRLCSTQLRSNPSGYTTFGEFDFFLPVGSYTMEVFAYGSDSALTVNSRTESAYTADKVRETFVATQALDITSTNAVSVNATLHRITSNLRVISTDNRTPNADAVRLSYSACGKSFNPVTALATVNSGIVNTVYLTYPAGQPAKINSYSFLNADQQLIDLTIDVLDTAGAVLTHKEVINVPLRRNARTVLQGQLFTTGTSTSLMLDTDYDTVIYLNF